MSFGLAAKGNLEKGMRENTRLSGAIRLHKHPCAQNALKPLRFFEEERKMKRNHRKFSSTLLIVTAFISLASAIVHADNIYVSSISDGTIVKFDSSGNKSTFASGLNWPVGLAFDRNGNLYVGTFGGITGTSTIEKYDPSGNKTTFAAGLGMPRGLAFDRNGNLYVSDIGYTSDKNGIVKFDPSGNRTTFASMAAPWDLAFDSSGYLYVSGVVMGWPWLNKVDLSGNVPTFASDLSDSWGIAFDRKGDLYVANQGVANEDGTFFSTIEKYDPSGNRTTFVSGLAHYATGLAFDSSGNLLAISGNDILKFDSSGNSTVFASGLLSDASWFIAVEPVPEPATLFLLTLGGLFLRRKK
jgi:dipeptidyl aminopeptidase/acylaminoacyl peptidase